APIGIHSYFAFAMLRFSTGTRFSPALQRAFATSAQRIPPPPASHQSDEKRVSSRFPKKIPHKISEYLRDSTDSAIEAKLSPLRAEVKEHCELVKNLKDHGAPTSVMEWVLDGLETRKRTLSNAEIDLVPDEAISDRAKLQSLIERHLVHGLLESSIMNCWEKEFDVHHESIHLEPPPLKAYRVIKGEKTSYAPVKWADIEKYPAEDLIYCHPMRAPISEILSHANKSKTHLPFKAVHIGHSNFPHSFEKGPIVEPSRTTCEVEHIYDPSDKMHPNFEEVSGLSLVLLSAHSQINGEQAQEMTIGEAVKKGIVASETLGYYMAQCQQFLTKIGIDPVFIRFRESLSNKKLWEAEIFTSYGWMECVRHEDKESKVLDHHYRTRFEKLTAKKKLSKPRTVNYAYASPNMEAIGKKHQRKEKQIHASLKRLSGDELDQLEKQIENGVYTLKFDGGEIHLKKDMVDVKRGENEVHHEDIAPHVFSSLTRVDRITYALMEHAFREREGDDQKSYLGLLPHVAPIKCSIFPTSSSESLTPIIRAVKEQFEEFDLPYDQSAHGSIEKNYSNSDERGIPFVVSIDSESEKEPWTVTVRHADSMEQIRVEVAEIGSVINSLVRGEMSWDKAKEKYPIYECKNDEM
ncbi:hypothetical protein PMAYCL1PPCAC_11695, partial [Pristionchus mayeri]